MRFESGRRERFLPYRYVRAGVVLRIDRCLLDDTDEVAPDLNAHLLELDVPWSEAKLTLAVEFSDRARAGALPEGSQKDALDLLIVLHCPSTLLRFAVSAPLTSSVAEVDLTVRRDDIFGSAHLQAFIVRRTEGPRVAGYASACGARLADSRPWELRVDRVRQFRGEYLDVRYLHFKEEATVPTRDRKNLYILRMDQDAPELWLNADHERIVAVLDSKGTVGRDARIREVAFDQIAHGVWTQLFLRSARDYVQSEETTYGWQEAVLDLVLRDLYPEVRNARERRDRLADEWSDFSPLLTRLDAALQRRGDLSAHLTKLVEESEDES